MKKKVFSVLLAVILISTCISTLDAKADTGYYKVKVTYDLDLKAHEAYAYVHTEKPAHDLYMDLTATYYDGHNKPHNDYDKYSLHSTQIGLDFNSPAGLSYRAAYANYSVDGHAFHKGASR